MPRPARAPLLSLLALGLAAAGAAAAEAPAPTPQASRTLPWRVAPDPREKHFGELTMLTDGGENAEAYWSFDGRRLVFQSTRPPYACDQILTLDTRTAATALVSTGRGRTTCAYWYPDGQHILYASTHLGSADCPPPPDMSRGYVWAIYPDYDIFRARADGSEPTRLTATPGYDAEATISPRGDRIVFTSTRDGDLDIYTMNLDGSDVRRLTDAPGYDGGPFFSPDGSLIVYRAYHPQTEAELADYRSLLDQDLIRPSKLDIWVMNADGSGKRRVTHLDCASFAPYFHPSGRKIIFSTNHPNPRSRDFDLWLVNLDGSGLEQVTFSGEFDGFPMWAPDGRTFVFCSNRHNARPGETNVFVTQWRD